MYSPTTFGESPLPDEPETEYDIECRNFKLCEDIMFGIREAITRFNFRIKISYEEWRGRTLKLYKNASSDWLAQFRAQKDRNKVVIQITSLACDILIETKDYTAVFDFIEKYIGHPRLRGANRTAYPTNSIKDIYLSRDYRKRK